MKLFSLKSGFWLVLFISVLIVSSFDISAVRQASVTDETGEMIVHTYKVMDVINKILLANRDADHALEYADQPSIIENMAILRKNVTQLKVLARGNTSQEAVLEKLSFLDLSLEDGTLSQVLKSHSESLAQILRGLRDREESTIENRLAADRKQNDIWRREVISASIFDLILFGLIATIWTLDTRARIRTEEILGSTIRAVSKTNFELEQISQAKTQLLKTTVHDLKNPLGSIKGFAELISEASMVPTIAEMSQIIQRVSAQSLEIVNTLVHPSALEKGMAAINITKIDLLKCIEDVCISLKPQTLQKEQKFEVFKNGNIFEIDGESQKIWDMFMNLIGNAVKFSPFGGSIRISLLQMPSEVCVEIEDEGPGFSARDKVLAFRKYQRLSAKPTGGEHSSGLGLSIVKDFIGEHKGSIEIADATRGHGARLIVKLPGAGFLKFNSGPRPGPESNLDV